MLKKILALLTALSLVFLLAMTACEEKRDPADTNGDNSNDVDDTGDGDSEGTDGEDTEGEDNEGGDTEGGDPWEGYPEMNIIAEDDFDDGDISDWTVIDGEWAPTGGEMKKVSGDNVTIVNKNWPNQLTNFVLMGEVRSIEPGAPAIACMVNESEKSNERLLTCVDSKSGLSRLYSFPSWKVNYHNEDAAMLDNCSDWYFLVCEYREGVIRAWVLPKGTEWNPGITPAYEAENYTFTWGWIGLAGWQGVSLYDNIKLYTLGSSNNTEIYNYVPPKGPEAVDLSTANRTLVYSEDFSEDPFAEGSTDWERVTGDWAWNPNDHTLLLTEGWDAFVLSNEAPADLSCFVYQADIKARTEIDGGAMPQLIFRFDGVEKWHAAMGATLDNMTFMFLCFGINGYDWHPSAPCNDRFTQDAWYTMRVLVNGAHYRVWFVPQGEEIDEDAEPVLEGDMSHCWTGQFGLLGCNVCEFDNIKVWRIDGEPME